MKDSHNVHRNQYVQFNNFQKSLEIEFQKILKAQFQTVQKPKSNRPIKLYGQYNMNQVSVL